jgi:hypothetical protein
MNLMNGINTTVPTADMKSTEHISLDQAERLFRLRKWTEEQTLQFIRDWNAGPHFTQAVLTGDSIQNFDPEECKLFTHLHEKCGVRV